MLRVCLTWMTCLHTKSWMCKQASRQGTHIYILFTSQIFIMRNIIIELTTYLFGAVFFSLCLILLVATASGAGFPLGFTMIMMGLLAGLALTNRILVWTTPRKYKMDHWKKVNFVLACIASVIAIIGNITWIAMEATMEFTVLPEKIAFGTFLTVFAIGLLMVGIKRYHQK